MQVASPADYLTNALGKSVSVKLNSGISYKGTTAAYSSSYTHRAHLGTLLCLDGFMNIALENSTEHCGAHVSNSFKNIFIRGNNGKETSRTNMVYLLCSALH
jgi:U6 snRNA-associated Sm-like protein LSm6